jgi:hypothetical protein
MSGGNRLPICRANVACSREVREAQ